MTERTLNDEPMVLTPGQHVFKTPEAVVPVAFHWRDELAKGHLKGHRITASRWAVVNAHPARADRSLCVEGLEIGRDGLTTHGTLLGGTSGGRYVLTNSIETTGGARIDRAVIVACVPS